jgi:hypothetical protein
MSPCADIGAVFYEDMRSSSGGLPDGQGGGEFLPVGAVFEFMYHSLPCFLCLGRLFYFFRWNPKGEEG